MNEAAELSKKAYIYENKKLDGGVQGGQVCGDWQGRAQNQLVYNGDLAATTDYCTVLSGLRPQNPIVRCSTVVAVPTWLKTMHADLKQALENGPFPPQDGWGKAYRRFDRLFPRGNKRRRLACRYYWPTKLERAGNGRIYRLLGVQAFGRMIPTGGVTVRRLTGARMAPYTLRGTSLGAAREFYYRTCAFESGHLPFMLAMLAVAIIQLFRGRYDLALEDFLVNLAVNIYPIMHHRHTRLRIVRLLENAARRAPRNLLGSD